MSKSRLRFFGPLNDLLKPSVRFRPIEISTLERRSVKDAVEALGVPHTEIDLITVDGESVGFDHLIAADENICVYPHFSSLDITSLTRVRPPALMKHRFVVDVHLGRLARRLRLLGFDTLYRNDWNDAELARCSEQEGRILLSQDRGLLKRRRVRHGQLVRAHEPDRQLGEVIERFDLRPEISPFRRHRLPTPEPPSRSSRNAGAVAGSTGREPITAGSAGCWSGWDLSRAPPPDPAPRGGGDGGHCRSAPWRSPRGRHR